MRFFHNFPYTDFHELNLDWFLKTFAELIKRWDDFSGRLDNVETAMDVLKNYVNDYFDNLDVQDEINAKLDEMSQDGSLQTILQRVADMAQVVTLNPAASIPIKRYALEGQESSHPNFVQAGCASRDAYFLFAANALDVGTCTVIKYAKHGGQLGTATFAGGHCNGACYTGDGKILIATINDNVSDAIVEMDPDTLQVTNTYSFDGLSFRSVMSDMLGNIYAASGATIYKLDLANETATRHCTLNGILPNVWQSGCICGNYIYEASTTPSAIFKYNLRSGQLSKIYQIDRYVGSYCVGEVESVFWDWTALPGIADLHVVSCAYFTFGNYRLGQIFKANIDTNYGRRALYTGGDILSQGQIYVDRSRIGGAVLPDGSQTNPFPTLMQALMAINSPDLQSLGTYTINLQSDVADEPLWMRQRSFDVVGNGHTIDCVYLVKCRSRLSGLTINKLGTGISTFNYPIYATECQIEIDDIVISQGTGDFTYSVSLNRSVGGMYEILDDAGKGFWFYHSNILTTRAYAPEAVYDTSNAKGFLVSAADLGSMGKRKYDNSQLCSFAIVRFYKSGSYGSVVLPLIESYGTGFMYINGVLEMYRIHMEPVANTGYTVTVDTSKAVSSGDDVSAPTIASVAFVPLYV